MSGAREDRTDQDDGGSAIVEYVLLILLIAVVCMVALNVLGGTLVDNYSQAGASVAGS